MSDVTLREADLDCESDQQAVVDLVDAYASDPMGRGKSLDEEVRRRLITGLRQHPTTLVMLACDAETPVGIAVCFLGFSTFAARPLINIHDLAVLPEHRGRGIGKALIAAVEQIARERGYWGLTLEVDERNERARQTYRAVGFQEADRVADSGLTLFMKKPV